MNTAEKILTTTVAILPFIEKVSAYIHDDGPEPEGLSQIPALKSRVELEKLKLRSAQRAPGVGT